MAAPEAQKSRRQSLLAAAVGRWAESLDCAPGTARNRATAARQFAAWAAEQGRSPAEVGAPEDWKSALQAEGGLRKSTIGIYVSAARAFQAWLAETERLRQLEEALSSHRTCRKALAEAPVYMLSEDLCLLAVSTAGSALEIVPECFLTEAVCLAAVQKTPGALRFVPEEMRTEAICLEAAKRRGTLLKLVPGGVLTEEICRAAAAAGCPLDRVPEVFRTAGVCLEAVRLDGAALASVPGRLRSRELCLEALARGRKDGWAALPFVPQELLDDAAFCTEAAGGPARCVGGLPADMAEKLQELLRGNEPGGEEDDDGGEADDEDEEEEPDDDEDEEEEEAYAGISPETFVPPVASGPPPAQPLSHEELKDFLTAAGLEGLKVVCTGFPCAFRDAFGQPMDKEEARNIIEHGGGPGAELFRKGILQWTLARAGMKKRKSGDVPEWKPCCCLTRFGLAVMAAAVNGLPRHWRGARAEALAMKGGAAAMAAEALEEQEQPLDTGAQEWSQADQDRLETAILRCAARHPEMRNALARMQAPELLESSFAREFWHKLLAWGPMAAPMLDAEERRRWKAWRAELPEARFGSDFAEVQAAVERRLDMIRSDQLQQSMPEDFGAVGPRC